MDIINLTHKKIYFAERSVEGSNFRYLHCVLPNIIEEPPIQSLAQNPVKQHHGIYIYEENYVFLPTQSLPDPREGIVYVTTREVAIVAWREGRNDVYYPYGNIEFGKIENVFEGIARPTL